MIWLTLFLLLQEQYEEPGEITIFSLLCSGIAFLILVGIVWFFVALLQERDHRMMKDYNPTNPLLDFVQRYLGFCNDPNSTTEGLREFYADYLVWQEMPHQFAPAGRTLGFAGMQAALMEGKRLMAEQHYVLDNVVTGEEVAALQISWEMTLGQNLGQLAAGAKLRGKLAIFMVFEQGKIIRQTDYICYDPQ